jgi:transglutaminase-like putative cysteine protease
MSAAAAAIGRLPRAHPAAHESLPLRLAAFAALAWVGAVEWQGLVAAPPTWRSALVVAIVTWGSIALSLAPRAPLPPRVRPLLYTAIVLTAALGACLAAGLSAKLLAPARWDTLGDGLDRGLVGASMTTWPYSGSDGWVRLTLMLGIPMFAVPAMALAFWPRRRPGPGVASGVALVLLLALYAVPATERDAGAPIARGLVLLVLIAAWLWLPRLRGRQLVPALAALAAGAVLALPAAAALKRHEAWVDYTDWTLFSDRAGGHAFNWDHRYGPLDWPRTGDTMVEVKSPHRHYWKTETLDRFDGLRWSHSGAGHGADPTAELPLYRRPRWRESIRFTIRGLRTNLLVGAGTVYAVDGDNLLAGSADGTIRVLDGPLSKGDSYTVEAYVPAPTAAQMRAAPARYKTQFLSYTYFDLPGPRDSAVTSPPAGAGEPSITPSTVGAPLPGEVAGSTPAVLRRIMASPYERTYRLARQLAAGQATAYDVVRNVERHLQRGFLYDERPPLRRLPLDAFLFQDKIGYCQQFSGAMALLLRMNGIPARVASGFSPGLVDPTTKEYRVRDLDAHSWVEVWFEGIGWVPFDPTPTSAPASAQASGDRLPSAATGGHDSGKDAVTKRAGQPVGRQGAGQVVHLARGPGRRRAPAGRRPGALDRRPAARAPGAPRRRRPRRSRAPLRARAAGAPRGPRQHPARPRAPAARDRGRGRGGLRARPPRAAVRPIRHRPPGPPRPPARPGRGPGSYREAASAAGAAAPAARRGLGIFKSS